jgi:DNA-directed RNA polymerase subunit RPC12/RpoP
MADPNGAQRIYRAPCPNCGAPVEFRSAQSPCAVCGFCHSAVVREGDTLKRLGKVAELFDDFSPLQLAATGRYEGQGFTLVGRLQYGYSQGRWTEWVAAFDDGQRTGVLSEDNGAYVFALPVAAQSAVAPASALDPGASVAVGGQRYTVSFHEQVALASAQGEMARLPPPGQLFTVVELRGEQGQILSFDYGSDPPAVHLGRSVQLGDLQLRGLRDESAKTEHGRSFSCPHCGAPVPVQLESTQSIACASCGSIIDISQGIGGELRHAAQGQPVQPPIALGSIGQLQGVPWQIVGFQRRTGHEPGEGESFDWDEYLLYHKTRGFCFLADTQDGWSVVAPTTGSPAYVAGSNSARYQGNLFRLESSYRAETTYVAGEFYWRVERGQITQNKDFASGRDILTLEASPNEQVWSFGRKIDSSLVSTAFRIDAAKTHSHHADAGPLSEINISWKAAAWIFIIVFILILSQCSDDSSSGSGRGGGYGGYSSGGGHK